METLGGFPNLPAFWLRRAKPGSAVIHMETLGGFPNELHPVGALHHRRKRVQSSSFVFPPMEI
jgi:hypothetical protein